MGYQQSNNGSIFEQKISSIDGDLKMLWYSSQVLPGREPVSQLEKQEEFPFG